MTSQGHLIAALLVAGLSCAAGAQQSKVYRCPQPAGAVALSDKPCADGDVRDGSEWKSVRQLERKRAEEMARLTEEAQKQRLERQAAEARRQDAARIAKPLAAEERQQSSEVVDKATTYAVILGRAIGCSQNVDGEVKRVASWVDSAFTDGAARSSMLIVIAAGMKHHAELQRAGRSPDSCFEIRRQLQGFPWP